MIYRLKNDDGSIVYPFVKEQLRSTFPNTSFPFPISDETAADFGCLPVQTIERPEHDPRTQRLVEGDPEELEDGTLQQVLTVRDATEEEIAAWDVANMPSPDYLGFYSALLTSPCYQAVLQQIMAAPTSGPGTALTVFVSAMQDCLAGRANVPAMQASINLLLGQVTLSEQHQAELQQLLDDAHLGSLYSLLPQESPPGDG